MRNSTWLPRWGVFFLPISDEALERFLGDLGTAAREQALAMSHIAARVDAHAEREQSNTLKIQLALVGIITGLMGVLGWLRFTGSV